MGADFFYLSASPIISDIPVVRINADYNILYNRELLLKKILANQPCYCITVNGPATLTVLKCNDTAYTAVQVVSGAVHYDCVSDMFDITSNTPILSGKKCTQQSDCVPATTTTRPISTTTSPSLTLPPPATKPPTPVPTPPTGKPKPKEKEKDDGGGGGGKSPKPEEPKNCCESVALTINQEAPVPLFDLDGCLEGYTLKWTCSVTYGACPPATHVEVEPDLGGSIGDTRVPTRTPVGDGKVEYTNETFVPVKCDSVEFEFIESPRVSFMIGGGGEVTVESETLRDNDSWEFLDEQISSVDNDTVTVPDGKGGFKRYRLDSFDNETQNRLRQLGEDIKNGDADMTPYGGAVSGNPCYPTATVKYTLEGSKESDCCSSTTSSTTTLTPPSTSSSTPEQSSTPCDPCDYDTPGDIVPPEKPADGGSSVTPSPSSSEVTPSPDGAGGDQQPAPETTECPLCDEGNTSGPRGKRSSPTPAEPSNDVTYDTDTETTTTTTTTTTTLAPTTTSPLTTGP